jgi:hypothetical protein
MAGQCGAILARIHATPEAEQPPLEVVDGPTQIEQYREIYLSFDEPRPLFDLAFRRLAGSLPAVHRPTLVHGDFRNGNLLVDPGGIRAVLDWELVHRGDPMEDLGWLCVNSWRFGVSERPVGGFGAQEELFAAYEQEGGTPIDRDRVRAWQVFGTLKWGVMCMIQAFAHLDGRTGSVEKAAIGRRVSETEADLARLLAPGAGRSAVSTDERVPDSEPARNERPSALDLLGAVRGYLLEDLRPGLEGKAAFDALVAANTLGIVERELALGPIHERLEREGMLDLLGSDRGDERSTVELSRALAEAIRSGELDSSDDLLLAHLRRSADRKLAIDNPKYRPVPEAVPP